MGAPKDHYFNGHRYSEAEKETIKKLWGKYEQKAIAERLGRTFGGIVSYCWRNRDIFPTYGMNRKGDKRAKPPAISTKDPSRS